MRKAIKISLMALGVLVVLASTIVLGFVCQYNAYKNMPIESNIVQIDLSNRASFITDSKYDYLYNYTVVDDQSSYMAHPDSIIINNKIVTMYVNGHGRGEILTKTSEDGTSYSERLTTTPSSWKTSEETPTLFELEFNDGSIRYIMVSANPKWPGYKSGDGFNVSISGTENQDDFATWSEFKKFYGKDDPILHVDPIVAMSSLIHLKENGEFVDKWMGIFHDADFKNYKTILTFDENGDMVWSKPVEYFKGSNKTYFDIAKKTNMCEVLMFRDDNNQGDKLCLITRSNTKKVNSLVSFSYDEGETWSEPKEIFDALNGERHKLTYLPNGRLAITFRSIERNEIKKAHYAKSMFDVFYSEGWIMWIGTWDDIYNWYNGTSESQGQYRIKIAHTFIDNTTEVGVAANADTGYCGNVLLDDGTIVTSSYGKFSKDEVVDKTYRTFIVSKRLKISDLDEIYSLYTANL